MKRHPSKITHAASHYVSVELWFDRWCSYGELYAIDAAYGLINVIESDELLQQRLRSLPGRKGDSTAYNDLRYVLWSLGQAKRPEPRRLTWWERITGRLKP
ncbi:hypothetical protein [Pseudomonas protegens]|uniref:hypothetical protein n=1 Tax=Pseudomonas protegens TaxID=380021 RepID=UPI001B320813|nr:hypothetical protein [Pseudomonas protegens]